MARPGKGDGKMASIKTSSRRVALSALLGVAVFGSMTGTAAAGGLGATIEVMMPPNEFIHRFAGKVAVMYLPHKAGNPMLSISHHANGQCAVWLPKVGDPEIDEKLYECLAVIEVANCNGATDINTPAVSARSSGAEQARYARTCSHFDWTGAFSNVREPAMTTEIASAATAARM
jgi:hypothetical protein